MKKIISLFKRNYEGDRLVYNEVVEGAEWVINGEGIATVKYDGTACLIREHKVYKRYDCKTGEIPPDGFEPAQPERDEVTGHWPGWLPVGDGPGDRWHREALENLLGNVFLPDINSGTYELMGPKVQGNSYGLKTHQLFKHGRETLDIAPRDFDGIRNYLAERNIQGIVWHHPDGRMVKIKRKDFGLPWPVKHEASDVA